MLSEFNLYCYQNKLIQPETKTLLAISGGIDSVVMAHLFSKSNFPFDIAHCNFQLRGDDSDLDQEFVVNISNQLNCHCFLQSFNTKEYADKGGISIQMAARELRYAWFHKLAEENNFDKIALAQHRDDLVETFFINIIRGTGIAGLTGIKPLNGKLIRPLLFADRLQIEEYANSNNIQFREDVSNAETKYIRNKIRLKILPLLREINPSLNATIEHEVEVLKSVESQFLNTLEKIKSEVAIDQLMGISILIKPFIEKNLSAPILFEIIKEYGFSYQTVQDMFASFSANSGKQFYSREYWAVKDREQLIIRKKENPINEVIDINSKNISIEYPLSLKFQTEPWNSSSVFSKQNNLINIDADVLKYPLTLRKWKNGDFFYPLGFKGKKKLSDFFVDHKFNLIDKQQVWLLLSGNDIVWVVGHRIDDRYKITPQTTNQLKITWNNTIENYLINGK